MVVDLLDGESGAVRPRGLMRAPATLMRAERLGMLQPCRLSATRALMAQAAKERWKIRCTRFDIDRLGRGVANYRVEAGGWEFSFPVFSFEPSTSGRTARIIGTTWDMMGALVEGRLTDAEFDRTSVELPKLYEGRASARTLIWARSNRSGRFFDQAVNALASGRQPDVPSLARVCYLMRNTGLDGNGTFGTKTFLAFEKDHPLRRSLAAQMLSAYMMRVFGVDLIHHLARLNGGSQAVEIHRDLQRFLGLGNASALGLIYYVHNHPRLIDQWLRAREQALAAGMLLPIGLDGDRVRTLLELIDKAIVFRRQDRSEYESFSPSTVIAGDLEVIRRELSRLRDRLREGAEPGAAPLADLCSSLEGRVHVEALETLHSMIIELVPDVAEELIKGLVLDEEMVGRPEMSVSRLREILREEYAWSFEMDLYSEKSNRYVWYKSRTAEEPRRGPRDEVVDAYNIGLDLPRLIRMLDADLAAADPRLSAARFLLNHPRHRSIVTRVQALAGLPYHSPHADIMSEEFIPAHLTRLMNSGIHGLDKTRDYVNRFIRGVMFHGAPLPDELAAGTAETAWFYPEEPRQ
jgi:hypothetical protein